MWDADLSGVWASEKLLSFVRTPVFLLRWIPPTFGSSYLVVNIHIQYITHVSLLIRYLVRRVLMLHVWRLSWRLAEHRVMLSVIWRGLRQTHPGSSLHWLRWTEDRSVVIWLTFKWISSFWQTELHFTLSQWLRLKQTLVNLMSHVLIWKIGFSYEHEGTCEKWMSEQAFL